LSLSSTYDIRLARSVGVHLSRSWVACHPVRVYSGTCAFLSQRSPSQRGGLCRPGGLLQMAV
jgi:hypothetical protein